MIDAPKFHRLTKALHPEGDPYPAYPSTGDILGALVRRKSLVMVSMHHPPVEVACTPVVRLIPRACPRRFFSLPLEWWVFFLARNSLKSMTKLRHESTGSRTVSCSSCFPTTFVLLTEGGWQVTHAQQAKANEVASSSF
jgi:hypothetical protein